MFSQYKSTDNTTLFVQAEDIHNEIVDKITLIILIISIHIHETENTRCPRVCWSSTIKGENNNKMLDLPPLLKRQ